MENDLNVCCWISVFQGENFKFSKWKHAAEWLPVVQLRRDFSCSSEFSSWITGPTRRYVMDQMDELHIVSQMLKLERFILNFYFISILKWATDQVIYFTTINYREEFKPNKLEFFSMQYLYRNSSI